MKDRTTTPKFDHQMSRRGFFAGTAAAGAAVTAAGILGTAPGRASAQAASAPVITPITEMTMPLSKAKEPFPIELVRAARELFSFPNWQAGGDDSVYYNLNIPEFFNCGLTPPVMEPRPLERAINQDLENLTFTARDGSQTPPLKKYLVGP
ncbi:hypothetical protein [Tropicimonas sp. IMCC6043]|uniref:hypothetical protein n=1 Tax=Tropicimonas sp. IMCC6043 TaxID=2510645 RepID=UPI0013ED3316|nr:hypothetical protein [Tropicimonas sp. IMCC6043]